MDASKPASPSSGDLFVATDTQKIYRYNGASWDLVSSAGGTGGTVTSITAGTGLSGGTITGSGTIDLANTAVTAGSYGSVTQTATFTVDAQGRLTAAGNTTVTPAWSSITSTPTTLAGYGITDSVSNLGGTPGIQTGLDAAKPATPTAGTIYFATDALKIYQYNSGSWATIASAAGSGGTITALTGDVSASGNGSVAATVNSVGGSTAANIATAEQAANAATSANTASTIVKRDASGNFTAGTITANLTGAASLNVLKSGDAMSGDLTFDATKGTVFTAGTGANTVAIQGPTGAIGTSYVLRLPTSVAASNGQVLTSDTAGNLTWTTPSTTATSYSGVLPVANGGTNSSTALNNNRIMVSSGGAIVEAPALTNGQLLVGSTGAAPQAAALTAGSGISITNGAGSITIGTTGLLSNSLADGKILVGNAGTAAERTPSGDVSMTNTGAFTVSGINGVATLINTLTTGQFLRYNGTNWINVTLSSASLSDGSNLINASQMPANCAAGQTLTFSSPTGTWSCSNIVVSGSNFANQNANLVFAGPASGGAAAPTFRTLVAADLPAGMLTGAGTAGYVPYYSSSSVLANSPIAVSGGNVGVGTASPQAQLSVESVGVPGLQIKTTGAAAIDTFNMINNMDATGYFWFAKGSSGTAAPAAADRLMGITNEGNFILYGQQIDGTTDKSGVLALKTESSASGGAKNEVSMEFYADRTDIDTLSGFVGYESGTAFDLSLMNRKVGNLFLGTSNATALTIDSSGKVGIGTESPVQALSVAGSVTYTGQMYNSSGSKSNAGTSIDWSQGNTQYTSASCGAFTFSNMKDGGTYTLAVQGTTSGTCTFSQGDAGDSLAAGNFKFVPANGATEGGTETIYTFVRVGTKVYVRWISGF